MFTWMMAACTFCSGAVVALVPFQRLGLDEQWLVSPGNISVPQFRLRALRPVSGDGRPLLFSCSAATAEPANISWDVSMDGSSVVSVDSRWGRFGSVAVVDSLFSIKAPESVRNASVACRITRPDGRQVALKTSLEGTADNLRQAAAYGEMGHECARRGRCKSRGATCRPSLLDHSLLCGCPTNKSAYDRFYDVCHKGQALHENCLFSEVCSSADANSRCVNGTCQCSEGLQSVKPGPCRRWGSYGERCDGGVAGCMGLGVVCGRNSVCTCARDRVRLGDTCVLCGSEPESDCVKLLTPRERVALISSVLITLTGVALAVASLLGNLRQRCCEGTGAHDDATFKIPEWAEPGSYYMSTRFWVSEQPYFAMDHREARLPPKKYFSW